MAAFYFTFLAALVAGVAGRDQITLARLTQAQGPRVDLLLAGLAISAGTAAVAAWGAQLVLPGLPARARLVLAAACLAIAGAESLLASARRPLLEPTRSLGAFALVLLAQQATDGVRLLVFGVAVATSAPLAAGIAGAAAGALLLVSGWLLPEPWLRPAARRLRRVLGSGLALVALALGAAAFGRI